MLSAIRFFPFRVFFSLRMWFILIQNYEIENALKWDLLFAFTVPQTQPVFAKWSRCARKYDAHCMARGAWWWHVGLFVLKQLFSCDFVACVCVCSTDRNIFTSCALCTMGIVPQLCHLNAIHLVQNVQAHRETESNADEHGHKHSRRKKTRPPLFISIWELEMQTKSMHRCYFCTWK